MGKDNELMWVHKDFKRRIKSEAGLRGETVINLTEKLAGSDIFSEVPKQKKERMGRKDDFFFKI